MKKLFNRKVLVLAGTLLLTGQVCAGSAAAASSGRSALDAFNALLEPETEGTTENLRQTVKLLDEIMKGSYEGLPEDTVELQEMAGMLPAFCSISDADLAFFASECDLSMARVRNSFYKGLANVLQAKISTGPAAEEKTADAETVLQLFLEMKEDPESESLRQTLRDQMTEAHSREMAQACGLPKDFVSFIIMDSSWNDDDWKNDTDWQQTSGWFNEVSASFTERNVGSQDAADETEIYQMQDKLRELGYLTRKPDGIFGAVTQAALLEFQMANGMRPTGVYTAYEYVKLEAGDAVARGDYDDEFWDPDDDEDWDDDDRDDQYDDDRDDLYDDDRDDLYDDDGDDQYDDDDDDDDDRNDDDD